jgi:hypothetical protein
VKATIKPVAVRADSDASSIAAAVGSLFRSTLVVASIAVGSVAALPEIARADEGGVSFWIPGFFGSLAAVPGAAGLVGNRNLLP